MRLIIVFCLILILGGSVLGQRVDEKEVAVEASFIAANQKKIIGKYDEAAKIYLKLLEDDPVNSVVLHDLARVYHAQEDLDQAVKYAQKAVRYGPENNWFKLTLAQFQLEDLDYKAAAKNFGDIATKTGDRDIYTRWARTLIDDRQYPAAIEVMNKMDLRFGKEESRSDDKIELFLAMDDKKRALSEIKSWISAYPNDIYYLTKLGKFYSFIDDRKKAVKTFEDVLDLEPKNGDALLALQELKGGNTDDKNEKIKSLIYNSSISNDLKVKALMPVVTSGSPEEVIEILPLAEYLATNNTAHPQSQALYADVLFLTNDLSGAQEYYVRTLALEKSNYQVWDQLLTIYDEQGDSGALSELSEEALDYFPNQGGPYYFLAKVALKENDFAKAKEMLTEATIVGGRSTSLQYKLSILNAHILDAEGDINGAISHLETSDIKHPNISELVGDLYIKIGEKTKAAEAFHRALKQGGNPERLKQKIEAI